MTNGSDPNDDPDIAADDGDDANLELASDDELEAEPVGEDALRQGMLWFEGWGLALPPVPIDLVERFRILNLGLLGTRDGTPGPDNLDWFVDDLATEPADYLLFGHNGHGIQSCAMHYVLVRGPLAVFVQIPWGGVSMANDMAAGEIDWAFEQCRLLLLSPKVESLASDQRLVVIHRGLLGLSRWGVIGRVPDAAALAGLTPTLNGLQSATIWAGVADQVPGALDGQTPDLYEPRFGDALWA